MKNASKPISGVRLLALMGFTGLFALAGPTACHREEAPRLEDGPAAQQDPLRCATCHMPEFDDTSHPPHSHARPTTCGVCHTQTNWKVSRSAPRVEHPWWPLTGAHLRAAAEREVAGVEKQVKCMWCHRGDPTTFRDTKKECISCHEQDRSRSDFPDHDTFAATCEDCHSTESWKKAKRPQRESEPLLDAGSLGDAGADAGDAGALVTPPPKPKPKPKPPKPPPTTSPTLVVPDIHTGPSARHR